MKVAIIGIGALGSLVAKKLSKKASLYLYDRDYVEEANLARQPFYTKEDIGKTKVEIATKKLTNSHGMFIEITPKTIELIGRPNLVICCTDSMQNKFLVNDYCTKNNIKAIFGSAVAGRGMIFINGESCFRCAFKNSDEESCEIEGILPQTSRMVANAITKVALNIMSGEKEEGLIYLNNKKTERIKVRKNEKCDACKGKYLFLSKPVQKISRLCGGTYIIRETFNFNKLKGIRFSNVVHLTGNSFFSDGRAFIRAENEKDAMKLFNSLTGNL